MAGYLDVIDILCIYDVVEEVAHEAVVEPAFPDKVQVGRVIIYHTLYKIVSVD
jgi:hypothetical protein